MTQAPASIRVICLGGAYLQPGARRFIAMLDAHPQVSLLAVLCQGQGGGYRHRLDDLWRRRGWLMPLVLLLEGGSILAEFLRAPREQLRLLGVWKQVRRKLEWFPDLHAPRAINRIQSLGPDLAVVYGGPLLKSEVYALPRLGTLGIHHGRAPAYRGKKTTFWEMYYGETHAGITIQQVGAGIDTGDVVGSASVEIGRRAYSTVWREVERIGCDLFLQTVLEAAQGTLRAVPQDRRTSPGNLFRQPSIRQLLSLRRHRRRALAQPGRHDP